MYFGASNYETDIYFNGTKLGKHIGGFTPFQFEVTKLLKDQNFLIVKVDNERKKDGVPTLNTDWWNYGGLNREVKLVETSSTYIADYHIYLSNQDNRIIKGAIILDGKDKSNEEITTYNHDTPNAIDQQIGFLNRRLPSLIKNIN